MPKVTQQKKGGTEIQTHKSCSQNPRSYYQPDLQKKISKGVYIMKYNCHILVEAVKRNKPEVR